MKNRVKAYKVVLSRNGRRVSAVEVQDQVKYRVDGEFVRPKNKGGGLFIFLDFKQAEQFCGGSGFEIWEVLANNVRPRALDTNGKIMSYHKFPDGTMFCSSLRMIKKVK
jgi:hypothetical protein